MKRTAFALGICLLCTGWCGAQAQEARDCFVQMPDTLSPLLTPVNRADFIDFLDSKMKAEVDNRFDGKSEMTDLTTDYIRVRMSGQSTWQMKLLPLNDSTKLICTVSTVCAPACDSHIGFYTTSWAPLPAADYLPALPGPDDFVGAAPDTADIYRYQAARRQADLLLMKADLSGTDTTLTFTFTTPDYMGKEAAEELEPFLRRPVVYRWRAGKFSATLP